MFSAFMLYVHVQYCTVLRCKIRCTYCFDYSIHRLTHTLRRIPHQVQMYVNENGKALKIRRSIIRKSKAYRITGTYTQERMHTLIPIHSGTGTKQMTVVCRQQPTP